MSAGPDFEIYFSDGFTPDLTDLFTPTEIADLQGADLSFFRIIVDSVSIQSSVDAGVYNTDVASSGRVELWIPTPGAAVLLGMAGVPLVARRRR